MYEDRKVDEMHHLGDAEFGGAGIASGRMSNFPPGSGIGAGLDDGGMRHHSPGYGDEMYNKMNNDERLNTLTREDLRESIIPSAIQS